MIAIHLNDVFFAALVDSGSSTTCVSSRVAQSISAVIRPTAFSFVAANASTLTTRGSTRVHFRLGSLYGTYEFTVMHPLSYDVIIGWDFLRKYKASPDPTNACLSVVDVGTIPFLPVETSPRIVTSVSLSPPPSISARR